MIYSTSGVIRVLSIRWVDSLNIFSLIQFTFVKHKVVACELTCEIKDLHAPVEQLRVAVVDFPMFITLII